MDNNDPLKQKPENGKVEKIVQINDDETQTEKLLQVINNIDDDYDSENLSNHQLCSKDSQWIDNIIQERIKLNIKSDVDKIDDESIRDEIELNSIQPTNEIDFPLYILFPNLRNTYPNLDDVLTNQISTTDIVKTIIGQKPDFSTMKTSKQLLPTKITLPSIDESSLESLQYGVDDEEKWEKLYQEDTKSLTKSFINGQSKMSFKNDKSLFSNNSLLEENVIDDEDEKPNSS